jgi:hypothetical protein
MSTYWTPKIQSLLKITYLNFIVKNFSPNSICNISVFNIETNISQTYITNIMVTRLEGIGFKRFASKLCLRESIWFFLWWFKCDKPSQSHLVILSDSITRIFIVVYVSRPVFIVHWSLSSEWLLFKAKWTIFRLYHGENKLILMRW